MRVQVHRRRNHPLRGDTRRRQHLVLAAPLPVRGHGPDAAAVARPEHVAVRQSYGVAVPVAEREPDAGADREPFGEPNRLAEHKSVGVSERLTLGVAKCFTV